MVSFDACTFSPRMFVPKKRKGIKGILQVQSDWITHKNTMDPHRLNADPDPTFHVDADPDPDPDWHQNDADPLADHTPSFKNHKYFLNCWSQQCQFTTFYLSHQCQICHNFQYFGQHIEIFRKIF
jgi:hypothetical protein